MQEISAKRARKSPILFSEFLRASIISNAILSVFSGVATIGVAFSVGVYIPRILNGETDQAKVFAVSLLTFGLIRAFVVLTSESVNAKSYISLTSRLRKELLIRLNSPATSSNTANRSQNATILTSGLSALEAYVRQYVPSFIEGLIVPGIVLASICFADLTSGLIILATVPLVPIFMILIGKQTSEMTSRQWGGLSTLTNQFSTFLAGIPTLRMYGQQEKLVNHIDAISQKYRRILMRTLRFAFLSAFALEAIATLSIAIVAVTLGVRLISDDVTFSRALFVLFAVPECYWPLRRLGAAFHSAETGKDAAKDIATILDMPVEHDSDKDTKIEGTIEVSDVKVCAEDGSIRMECKDARIPPGSIVGIVGPNGSGKSTFIDVLRGNLTLTSGHIKFGKVPIDSISKHELAEQVAYVPQSFTTYGDTVREAITWSKNYKTETELIEISKTLGIEDLLEKKTSSLSGGQHQRVSIAHAIFLIKTQNVNILIADEPTSQLDHENAMKVFNAFKELTNSGTTVIFSTHDERLIPSLEAKVEIVNANQFLQIPTLSKQSSVETTTIASLQTDKIDTRTIQEGSKFFSKISRRVLPKSIYAISIASLADIFTIALTGVSLWLIVRASQHPLFVELSLAALFVRVCGIGKAVFRYIERLSTHAGALDIVAKLRLETTSRLIRLAPAGFPELRKGDMLARVIDDHERAQDLFIRSILPAFSTFFTGIVSVAVVSYLNVTAGVYLAVGVLIGSTVVPLSSIFYEIRMRNRFSNSQNEYVRQVCDYFDAQDILISSRGISYSLSKINSAATEISRQLKTRSLRSGIFRSILAFLPSVTVGLTVLSISNGATELKPPELGIVFLIPFAVLALYESHHRFGEVFADGTSAWARIQEIISRPVPISAPSDVQTITADSVELQNASFSWDSSEPAYKCVSFMLDNNAKNITLSGPSGVGKSTLAAGLVRFIDVRDGAYLFGNKSVHHLFENDIRERIIWNQQSPWLLPGTIRENLLLGNPDATEDEINSALDTVNASEFINRFEKGIDRFIGINGELLSIGEKNKISIARTLLSTQKIRIFDEPTASLDVLSSSKLMSEITSDSNEYLSITITHDQSQVSGKNVIELYYSMNHLH